MDPFIPELSPHARAEIDALPPGSCRRIDLDRQSSLIAVRGQNILHLFLNRCPHRGTELDWTPGILLAADGYHLQCATHGALFDPESGECISGPCVGQSLRRVAHEA